MFYKRVHYSQRYWSYANHNPNHNVNLTNRNGNRNRTLPVRCWLQYH